MTRSQIHPDFKPFRAEIEQCIANFATSGVPLGEAARNSIKIFEIGGKRINIKSFKKPTLINKLIYRYVRKSKAERSYEYANLLISKRFKTPQPIAYYETQTVFGLEDSYYVSEQIEADIMFRDLITNRDYPDREEILKQYAQFAFALHERGIEFIDNTSGNTLIINNHDETYNFYLVDLNRMKFHKDIPFDRRIANIAKLTTQPDALRIMSDQYARLTVKDPSMVFKLMTYHANRFLGSFERRRRLKKKIRFWKKQR